MNNPSNFGLDAADKYRPDLLLVGCVKTKRAVRSKAKDLYNSPLWRRRRAYAESLGVPWFILSALHGLLDPNRRIDPYDLALTDLRVGARRAWSARVLAAIKLRLPSVRGKTIEIHAGADYVNHGVADGLQAAGAEVRRPLADIAGVGRQQTWYLRQATQLPDPAADRCNAADRPDPGRVARLIADDFYRADLDLPSRGMAAGRPWSDMPEVKAVDRLRAVGAPVLAGSGPAPPNSDGESRAAGSNYLTNRALRLFLTFVAAMDRARDADQLWRAGTRLYESHPEFFEPASVAEMALPSLRGNLATARVSRRHGPDSEAWHQIAVTLSSGTDTPVRRAIDLGRGDACELLRDLGTRDESGRNRFPLLRGPKLGPMWIRMMASPGLARIDRIETVPVAVDVQVRRTTENLGVAATQGLPLRKAKPLIQRVWRDGITGVRFAGPDGIAGTCAALDPALWFFGKHGCGHCERVGAKVAFGSACASCVRF